MEIFNGLLNLLYPENLTCIFCDEEIFDNNKFCTCENCQKNLPFIKEKVCERCGDVIKSMATFCDHCQKSKTYYDKARSVFYYKDEIRNCIKKFKFDGCKYLYKPFAEFMAKKYKEESFDCDVITYVPIHETRLKMRGYNQAELLAKELAKILNLPFVENAIIKTKKTLAQADLNYKQRQSNLLNVFKVVDKNAFKNKNVLIVDDIFTTGATIGSCAGEIKKANANKVFALTLAHTIIEE